jgi:hypothetical protein
MMMVKYALMRFFQIMESMKIGGFNSVVGEIIYFGREAVIVRMNLKEFNSAVRSPADPSLKCIDITPEILKQPGYDYQFKNRRLKASCNLQKGLLGFGLLKDGKIIGDLWYYSPAYCAGSPEHKDLKRLGLSLRDTDVYGFDMFLNPENRGHNASTYFQGSWLLALRDRGVENAYGYYWADNTAALWVHRILKWKELDKLKLNRFLFIKKVTSSQMRPRLPRG